MPDVKGLHQIEPSQMIGNVVILCSTYGNGDPPDNAREFYDQLFETEGLDLSQVRFAVFAMGDQSYPNFCRCGRDIDRRLEGCGAKRLITRVDCDVKVEAPFAAWLIAVQRAFRKGKQQDIVELQDDELISGYSAAKPVSAYVVENRLLSRIGSSKETRHYEVNISGTALAYQPGDAIGIKPTNSPELVTSILELLGDSGERTTASGRTLSQVLLKEVELRRPSLSLVRWIVQRSNQLSIDLDDRESLVRVAAGNDVLDLLKLLQPADRPTAQMLVELCESIRPRLYSIASSPLVHPGSIHLTVSTVRYQLNNRTHHGAASTFLADRVRRHEPVPVYVQSNPNFRLPENTALDIIMVGPGTGIAPFRGFLYHRDAQGAKGRNWLFFGDQHAETDFLYDNEIERWRADGLITRLSTAFSRDQADKLYVQDRMIEAGAELFSWLNSGAIFYVCGDSNRMARGVDQALHQIIGEHGRMGVDDARTYIKRLQHDGRYKRDVY